MHANFLKYFFLGSWLIWNERATLIQTLWNSFWKCSKTLKDSLINIS